MENGAQLAGGGHWLAAAPPNIRDRVVEKMYVCSYFSRPCTLSFLSGLICFAQILLPDLFACSRSDYVYVYVCNQLID
jgi:hypothetical protein